MWSALRFDWPARTAVLLMLVLPLLAFAQQHVVVESSVGSIPVGSNLAASTSLDLSAGQVLSLIAESGELKVITGPYMGLLSAQSEAVKQDADKGAVSLALRRLISARRDETSALGAVRRLGASLDWLQPHAANGWNVVSAEHDGVQCVVQDQPFQLIRRNLDAEQAQLRSTTDNYIALSWLENSVTAQWPSKLTVKADAVYLLRRAGVSIPYRIQIKQLDATILTTAPAFQVASLMAHRCGVQAELARHAAGL